MKIAILVPGELPIPSQYGGAIETLTTHIINENEKSNLPIYFTIYNQTGKKLNIQNAYQFTKIENINCFSIKAKTYLLIYKFIRVITLRKFLPATYYEIECVKRIKRDNFDHILIEGSPLQTIYIKKKVRKNTILHLHTDILNGSSYMCNKIVKSCDQIIAVSSFIKNRVEEIVPNNSKLSVLKNCIDTLKFVPNKHKNFREQFRKERNINKDDFLIIYTGRLSIEKGVKELIIAFEKIKNLNCKLLIVGGAWFSSREKTDYIKELEDLAKTSGDKVIFTGYVKNEDLPQFYAAADFAVVPSICNEAAGLVILEAMSSGLPVVASNKGGINEYANSESCEIVDCDDNFINNLAQAMAKFITNDSYYTQKKSRARVNALQFNLNNYYKEFKRIISTNL